RFGGSPVGSKRLPRYKSETTLISVSLVINLFLDLSVNVCIRPSGGKSRMQNSKKMLYYSAGLMLLAGLGYVAKARPFDIESGKKAKVTGSIVSRRGDLAKVREKKTGEVVVVDITDSTQIERTKDFHFRHK